MSSKSELRKKIEDVIGREILEKHCSRGDEFSSPIMIPPIPNSKFFDKLPKDSLEGANVQEKKHQDGYVAEVELYRYFEETKGNHLVVHQLEYTHEQYSVFLPEHHCNTKKCKKGPEKHLCHKKAREIEGECDFVVMGDHFVAVFEVKGLSLQQTKEDNNIKFKGCCDSALTQRKRTTDLIKSIEPSVMIFEFTVFPNISEDEVDESYLRDETILFSNDLMSLVSIVASCEERSSLGTVSVMDGSRCCLLGLWCINLENKWDFNSCSFPKCLKDVDEKLRYALITRKLVDEAKSEEYPKKGKWKGKIKKYPYNPEMVDAPQLFKDYLKINSLTKDQLDAFQSDERFLWVEGPAGSGKTIVMLGKVIDLALTTPPEERILVILTGSLMPKRFPAAVRQLEILNDINDTVKCEMITYEYNNAEGDILFNQYIADYCLLLRMRACTSKIVLLIIGKGLAEDTQSFLRKFDYIFVDDYQLLVSRTGTDLTYAMLAGCAGENIISDGLFHVVKKSDSNNTSIWVFCDELQAYANVKIEQFPFKFNLNREEFKRCFANVDLSVNLRNAYEISSVLSIIKEHEKIMDISENIPVNRNQKQDIGHFLRASKPVIYLLTDDNTATWKEILVKELEKVKGPDSYLENKDIAVIIYAGIDQHEHTQITVTSVLSMWNEKDNEIMMMWNANSTSAEWPAIIYIHTCTPSIRYAPDESENKFTLSNIIPNLYSGISRARVYSAAIMRDYNATNICKYDEQLIEELKQRRDVCRIIEFETPQNPSETMALKNSYKTINRTK